MPSKWYQIISILTNMKGNSRCMRTKMAKDKKWVAIVTASRSRFLPGKIQFAGICLRHKILPKPYWQPALHTNQDSPQYFICCIMIGMVCSKSLCNMSSPTLWELWMCACAMMAPMEKAFTATQIPVWLIRLMTVTPPLAMYSY
jgi:hypothetical protein